MALMVITLVGCSAEKIDLVLNLENGKTYRQETSSSMNITQSFMGQEMNMEMIMDGVMLYKVTGVTDAGYEIEVTYEKLASTMKMAQGEFTFSSEDNDQGNPFSKSLSLMINKPFKMTLSKNGRVTSVQNLDELWDEIINGNEELGEAERMALKEQMMNSYGEKSFKGNIEMAISIFPDYPVNVGDKWTVDSKVQTTVELSTSTEYEFIKVENGIAFLKGTATMNTGKDNKMNQQGVDMEIQLEGTMTSDLQVDVNTGWIIEGQIEQDLKGKTTMADNEDMPGGMSIPMKMKNVMKVKGK